MKSFKDLANLIINPKGSSPIYSCLLYLNNPREKVNYNYLFDHMDCKDNSVSNEYRFRTGSITKTFTATIILQLMEEGKLSIEDSFLDQIENPIKKEIFTDLLFFEGVNYSNQITIKNLLQHKSGIRDYFADDDRFFTYIMNSPNHKWEWKKIMEKYFEYDLNKRAEFIPNEGYYYSDTNYLLLAILIEELSNISYDKALEKRILEPLKLQDTYLEFYQDKKGSTPIKYPFHGTFSLEDINTSFDWGGGGLISSVTDLDVFLRALLSGKLFNEIDTLSLMMPLDNDLNSSASTKKRISYGMGLQQKTINGDRFIGHNSAYGGMMFYNMEKDLSIILNLNQVLAPHKAEWLMKKIIETIMSDKT